MLGALGGRGPSCCLASTGRCSGFSQDSGEEQTGWGELGEPLVCMHAQWRG